MSVLVDLKNRGVTDVFFVVCDGLKGPPDTVEAVWPQAIVQTCIIHLIRNTFRLTSRAVADAIKRDIKPIYTAVNADAALTAVDDLEEKWGGKYRAMIRCGVTRGTSLFLLNAFAITFGDRWPAAETY